MPDFGKRQDGTQKGAGFFGVMERPDGRVSSELSITVDVDGEEMLIPSMVPGLNEKEMNFLLSLQEGDGIPESILKKATDHALKRRDQGRSAFIEDDEKQVQPPGKSKGVEEPTGTLLQDVTVPSVQQLDGPVELFKTNQVGPPSDANEKEINRLLLGK